MKDILKRINIKKLTLGLTSAVTCFVSISFIYLIITLSSATGGGSLYGFSYFLSILILVVIIIYFIGLYRMIIKDLMGRKTNLFLFLPVLLIPTYFILGQMLVILLWGLGEI